MVMATNPLTRLTDHGPGALKMKFNPDRIETKLQEVKPGLLAHLLGKAGEWSQIMQLPNAIEITGPGTSGIGIALRLTAEPQHLLDQQHPLPGIKRQPHLSQSEWKQRLKR